MDELKGLDVLEEIQAAIVTTRDGDYTFAPIKMAKFKKFATLAFPLVNDVMNLTDGFGSIIDLIEKHEQPLIDLIALTCDSFTREQYDNLYPDDFVAMVTAMVEVNMDFFVRNLLPKVVGQIEGLKAKMELVKNKITQKAGLVKSSASLATGTTSPTSKTTH